MKGGFLENGDETKRLRFLWESCIVPFSRQDVKMEEMVTG